MDDRRLLETAETDIDREVDMIAEEFRAGFEQVALIDRPAVAMFGSARVSDDHPAYVAARAAGRMFAERDWAVITGGGSGVMQAANRGAREGGGLSASTSSCCTNSSRTHTSTSSTPSATSTRARSAL